MLMLTRNGLESKEDMWEWITGGVCMSMKEWMEMWMHERCGWMKGVDA